MESVQMQQNAECNNKALHYQQHPSFYRHCVIKLSILDISRKGISWYVSMDRGIIKFLQFEPFRQPFFRPIFGKTRLWVCRNLEFLIEFLFLLKF